MKKRTKRVAKRRIATSNYKFAGRTETGELEQAVASLLLESYHKDQVKLVPTAYPKKPEFTPEQKAQFIAGNRDIKRTYAQIEQQKKYDKFYDEEMRVIPDDDWATQVSTILFNRGYYDKHIVLMPKSVLEKIYQRLISAGITNRVARHPRLESKVITKKFQAQKDARTKN